MNLCVCRQISEEWSTTTQRLSNVMSDNVDPIAPAPLPYELIDLIIEHAHDRRSALRTYHCEIRNYALVCRAWLPPSRNRIFKNVYLRCRTEEELSAILDQLDFLRTSDSVLNTESVLSYIRHFTLLFSDWDRSATSLSAGDTIMNGLPCLPHVDTLAITVDTSSSFGYVTTNCHLTPYATFAFPNITSLRLQDVKFSSMAALLEPVSTFLLLEHIELVGCFGSDGPTSADLALLPPPPRLQSISLKPFNPLHCRFLNWVLSGSCTTMHSLSVGHLHSDVEAYSTSLKRVFTDQCDRLRNLRLSLEFTRMTLYLPLNR